MAERDEPVQLRILLRQGTASAHAALDGMTEISGLANPADYRLFLHRQFRARLPVEQWAAANSPAHDQPPAMSGLIAADLQQLGYSVGDEAGDFSLPSGADTLGLAWVLSGSHLGNRIMMKAMRAQGANLPTNFLGDETMGAFWRSLASRLDAKVTKAEAAPAIATAEKVFAHFLQCFAASAGEGVPA